MAIDWTKPIRQKNGKALRFLHELQSSKEKYPVNCVATSDDGNEYRVTYTKDGRYNITSENPRYDAENIPATERALPEIDWTVDVQVRFKNDDPNAWTDVIIVYHDEQVALGWEVGTGPRHVLLFSLETNEFRNRLKERIAELESEGDDD